MKFNKEYNIFLKTLPINHIEKIDYIIKNSNEIYRSIFLNNLKYIKIKNINWKKSVFSKFNISGMSIPSKFPLIGGIYLNTTVKGMFTIDGKKIPIWYETLFHEIGHAVDYNTINNKLLNNFLRDDLKKYIYKLLSKEKYSKYSDFEKTQVVNLLMKKKKFFYMENTNINIIINELSIDAKIELWGHKKAEISDVFGIMTNNKITGNYSHGKYYERLLKIFIFPDAVKLEFFAHNFANGMLNNTDKQKLQKKYLKSSDIIIKQLIKRIYDKIKKQGQKALFFYFASYKVIIILLFLAVTSLLVVTFYQ